MNSLGIYFGPKIISLVQTKGKKVLNNIQIPRLAISTDEAEEKVPNDVKIVALFKNELRKNKIEAKEANIGLSGKDLVIRTFEIPVLPREELLAAVNFEAKKYIPFKIEDLISDFQLELDKSSHKNTVLFVGIKKETIDKYLSILSQLEIKVAALEYSAFAILRFLKLTNLSDKGTIGMISADLQEADEVNFLVLENGFPLFSREIELSATPQEVAKPEEQEPGIILEKLKTEMRVSLDYYHRKFPAKNIEKLFFIANQEFRPDLETFITEIGLPVQFIDIAGNLAKHTGKPIPFSLSLLKSYSCSLANIVKAGVKINLLSVKAKAVREIGPPTRRLEIASILTGLKIEPKIVILGVAICILSFLFGVSRSIPLQNEIKRIISMRPEVPKINPDASYAELKQADSQYRQKLNTLDNLIKKQLYLTESLDALPRLMPEGVWLEDFSFKKEEPKVEFTLRGIAYLADHDKELQVINQLVLNLKENPYFNKYFGNINIVSVDHRQIEKITVTNFVISCRNFKGRE